MARAAEVIRAVNELWSKTRQRHARVSAWGQMTTHTHTANTFLYQPSLCSADHIVLSHTHTHKQRTHTNTQRSVVCARRNWLKIVDTHTHTHPHTHCVQLSLWVTSTHSSQRHTSFSILGTLFCSEKIFHSVVHLVVAMDFYLINIVNIKILCWNFFSKTTWCPSKDF